MEDKQHLTMLLEKAHRDEVKASNEMFSDEQKVIQQREQLETCLDYREECLGGLKNAKTSGLSVVQIRECQLLVQYLDTVVEDRQYKSDICEEKYEKTQKIWQNKNEHYIKLKETLKRLIEEDGERMIGGEPGDSNTNDESGAESSDYKSIANYRKR